MSKLSNLLVVLLIFGVKSQHINGNKKKFKWMELNESLMTFIIDNSKTVQLITSNNIELNYLKDVSVRGLNMDGNVGFEYLPINIYRIFPYLVAYSANNCSVKKVSIKNFQDLRSLKIINLFNNRILRIPANTFIDLEVLEMLNLGANRIDDINENAFRGLKNLETLSLDRNRISHLPENLFDNLLKLEWINLSDNNLHSLNDNHFKKNVNLRSIHLEDNILASLSPTMFDHILKLKYLFLNRNACVDDFCSPLLRYSHECMEKYQRMKNSIKKNCVSPYVLNAGKLFLRKSLFDYKVQYLIF